MPNNVTGIALVPPGFIIVDTSEKGSRRLIAVRHIVQMVAYKNGRSAIDLSNLDSVEDPILIFESFDDVLRKISSAINALL